MRTAEIISAVARSYDITLSDICSHVRRKDLVEARHCAAYLCYTYTEDTLEAIARKMNRDHSTLIYAIRKVRSNGLKEKAEAILGAVDEFPSRDDRRKMWNRARKLLDELDMLLDKLRVEEE